MCEKTGTDHIESSCPDRCAPSCKQLGALSGRVRPESTIKGCGGHHITFKHRCDMCLKIGVKHLAKDCPDRCKIKGCGGYHLTSQHDVV